MKFRKITDAHKNFGQLIQLIEEQGEDIILIKNGKPCILLKAISEDDLEDYIVAKHFGVDKLAREAVGDTVSLEDVE